MGDLPLMTERGTFIINGTERVVVSQLHRSPGASFSHDKGRTHSSGKVLFSARISPYRGSWLDFEFDARDILYVRVDRRRKMPATILLKAFGLSTRDILKTYYRSEEIRVFEGKLLRKLDPDLHSDLHASVEVLEKDSNTPIVRKGTRLTKTLIAKMRAAGVKEMPVEIKDLIGCAVLAEIRDPVTNEVLIGENQRLITTETIEFIMAKVKHKSFKVTYLGKGASTVVLDTLDVERADSQEEAWVEIYKRLRPGEQPSVDSARELFRNSFRDPKRYDLSPVGRLKIDTRFKFQDESTKSPQETTARVLGASKVRDLFPDGGSQETTARLLAARDVVEVIRTLVDLKMGKEDVDDIDHLGYVSMA